MSKPQICQITGIQYNNPKVCIKGNRNYACVCVECIKEKHNKLKRLLNEPVYDIGLTSFEMGLVLDALDRFLDSDESWRLADENKTILIKDRLYNKWKLTQNI